MNDSGKKTEKKQFRPKKCHPERIIIHTGTNKNNLKSSMSEDEISNNIVKVSFDLKTDFNEVTISAIVPKDDELHTKGLEVNKSLEIKIRESVLGFVTHNNINIKNTDGVGILVRNYLRILK